MSAVVPPGYKQTEVGVIPEGWEVSTVGAEFTIQLGKMLDIKKNAGIAKPFLGNRAVQWGRIDLTGIGEIKLTPSDLQRFRLRDGDLLVCEGGEVGRAAIWNQPLEECYYQKALHRLRPVRGYNNKLMLNVLQYLSSSGFLFNYVTQTSIAHLPKDKFETVPIPLPATKLEQQRIAEALSDADALIEGLEQLITKKRQLKSGTTQELLTEKTRLVESADIWSTATLGELERRGSIRLFRGKVISQKDIEKAPGNYPIYSSSVHQSGLFGHFGRYMFDEELITWSVDGGGNFFYRPKHRFSVTNVCGYLRLLTPSIDCRFLAYELQHLHSSEAFDYTIKAHPSVIRGIYKVALPTISEQKRIATVLSDMDAEIAGLEVKLDKARRLKEGMMQDLLTGKVRLV